VLFVEHARAHAAAAYFTSPWDSASILVLDDVGEWTTSWFGRGKGASLEVLGEQHLPHSLGLFAAAMTQFLGFEAGADEALVEELAALGRPGMVDALGKLVLEAQGVLHVDARAFRFAFDTEKLVAPELESLLGPARRPGAPLRAAPDDARDADLAASLEAVLAERALAMVRELHRRAPDERLCLGGVLAANRSVVAHIAEHGPFAEVFVPQDPGEAGTALGAALAAHHLHLDGARPSAGAGWRFLGEGLDDRGEAGGRRLADDAAVCSELSTRLRAGQVVGWARGRLEFGQRSLSSRIALAAAGERETARKLLGALGRSEDWLACRVALPAERAAEYIELPSGAMRDADASTLADEAQVFVRARAALAEAAPGALLADGRVWPQLVRAEREPRLHALLLALGAEGAIPACLLTDLALRGQPIVRIEVDALESFRRSRLDALIVEDRLYERS
jgi:carbamoyltransferase